MTYQIDSRGGIRHKIDGDMPTGDEAGRLLAAQPRDLPYTQCNRIVVPARFHPGDAPTGDRRACSRCFPRDPEPQEGRPADRLAAGVRDIGDLYLALRRAMMGAPNCDHDTMLVIDLPDGTSRPVVSVRYEEDLAGALVIRAGEQLTTAGGDPE